MKSGRQYVFNLDHWMDLTGASLCAEGFLQNFTITAYATWKDHCISYPVSFQLLPIWRNLRPSSSRTSLFSWCFMSFIFHRLKKSSNPFIFGSDPTKKSYLAALHAPPVLCSATPLRQRRCRRALAMRGLKCTNSTVVSLDFWDQVTVQVF